MSTAHTAQPDTAPEPMDAIVVGSSGGIGAALVRTLAVRPDINRLAALSRTGTFQPDGRTLALQADLLDEAALDRAMETLAGWQPRLVLIAVGQLHGEGWGPEKRLADLTREGLERAFAANAIAPALALSRLSRLLPRHGRSAIGVLSARVGSISDNRLGGWHGYRAGKAALNMIIACASVELARSRPDALVVGLHPGTVDTGLSKPFQAGVPQGGLFTADQAARQLLTVIEARTPADSGRVFDWAGEIVPP